MREKMMDPNVTAYYVIDSAIWWKIAIKNLNQKSQSILVTKSIFCIPALQRIFINEPKIKEYC